MAERRRLVEGKHWLSSVRDEQRQDEQLRAEGRDDKQMQAKKGAKQEAIRRYKERQRRQQH